MTEKIKQEIDKALNSKKFWDYNKSGIASQFIAELSDRIISKHKITGETEIKEIGDFIDSYFNVLYPIDRLKQIRAGQSKAEKEQRDIKGITE